MAEPPSAPLPPDDPATAHGAADDTRDRAGSRHGDSEEYGPLALARHRKDDGRELILYSRRPD
jgi:hypothetical protein